MIPTFHVRLVGNSFRTADEQAFMHGMVAGETLTLERDPENPYDDNAIKVIADEFHLGFVERQWAEDIAPLMDNGQAFHVTVLTVGRKPLLELTPA